MSRALGCLVVAVAGVLAAAMLAAMPFWPALEERTGLDLLFALRGTREPPPSVAVVSIDAAAAEALGQPLRPAEWSRSLHARLIDRLATAGASVIAFDLSFARSGVNPEGDAALADALERAGNVVLLDVLEPLGAAGDPAQTVLERLVPPAPVFSAAAAAHGPFPLPKHDAVRGWWLQKPMGSPTMPVLAARLFTTPVAAALDPAEEARYFDFYGPPGTIPTLGFQDVLSVGNGDEAGMAKLRRQVWGRVVFVGYAAATSEGQDHIRDSYDTIFTRSDGVALSGVEIAATAFANLLEDRWPRQFPLLAQAGVWIVWAALLGQLCVLLPTAKAVPAVLVAVLAYVGLLHQRFAADAQWLPVMAPLLVQVPVALLGGALWHWTVERRVRHRYGTLIDDLLPRQIAEAAMARLPGSTSAEQNVYGVFVMTDVAGFTTMAEWLDPVAVTQRLNAYFGLIFPAVERHGGSVSEINGDAMLAFWLASGHDEQAVRLAACAAALEIAALTVTGHSPAALPTRIGVHAGPIALARLGASRHHEYRAVGDAANTASRLESLSKHLGTCLLASEHVVSGLHDELLTRPLGEYVLVGKSAAVSVHEIVAVSAASTDGQRERCASFATGLAAYRARRWDEAAACWETLIARWPDDGPSRYFLAQTRHNAKEEPPADWDGAIRLSTK